MPPTTNPDLGSNPLGGVERAIEALVRAVNGRTGTTTDANGWQKAINLFGQVQFRKRVTFTTPTWGAGTLATVPINSNNIPSELATLTGYFIDFSRHITSGNAYAIQINSETGSAGTVLSFSAWTDEGSRAYTGYIDVTLTKM